MTVCPVCGEPNPARASFCLNCGAQLPAAGGASRPARKTVTVVFTDLAGSGALGQRLDPESLAVVMARWFDHMRGLFERHGGRVQKFVGDAVVAVFGIPVVNEDDALRAVRAAADLGAGLGPLNDELERDWGVRLEVRTGVNTGEVVTGDPAIGDALVLGDAVNVAARLEQVAAPGEVLLGQSTYRLVRDAVSAERVTPLLLKGKGAPVVAYRLGQVDPGASGHARRQDAPIVGREPELRLFAWVYERVVSTASSHLLTVLGQAGMGKTRLVGEAVAALAAGDRAARPLPVLRRGHHLLAGGRDRPPGRRHRRHRRPGRGQRQAAAAGRAGRRRARGGTTSPAGSPSSSGSRPPPARPRRRPGRSGGCWSCWPRGGRWWWCSTTSTGPSRACSTWSSTWPTTAAAPSSCWWPWPGRSSWSSGPAGPGAS